MNKMKKVIHSLEKKYQVSVTDLLTSYIGLMSVKDMAALHETTPHVIREILLHLQLKRPKGSRVVCYNELTAMLDDEPIDEFTSNLEEDVLLLQRELDTKERALVKARVDLNRYRKVLREESKEEKREDNILDLFRESLPKLHVTAPTITFYKNPSRSDYVATLLISDVHAEESVDPTQVGKLNEFNWDVMQLRLDNLFNTFVNTYQGEERCVVVLGGDLFSGIIHEQQENSTKNIADAVVKLAQLLAVYLKSLACIYDVVDVKCVNGNHGRLSEKIKSEAKGFDFEYMCCMMVKSICQEGNIDVDVSTTGFNYFKVGNKVTIVHHGDLFRQAPGTESRDFKIYEAFKNVYGFEGDHVMQGHTHQFQTYFTHRGTSIVNGSVIGSNHYGHTNGFTKIPAIQTIVSYKPDGLIEYIKPVDLQE